LLAQKGERNCNALTTFDFNGSALRTTDRDGNPWFVHADACRVLEIVNPSQALSRLDDDEKTTLLNAEGRPGSGAQVFSIISESGLYSLILTSRKPQTREFTRWVTGTDLPSIRQHGIYVAGQEKVETGELTLEDLGRVAADAYKRLSEALTAKLEKAQAANAALTATVIDMEPKAIHHDTVFAKGSALSLTEVVRKMPGVNTMAIKRDLMHAK
jgi:prophage antirepressor-like protein